MLLIPGLHGWQGMHPANELLNLRELIQQIGPSHHLVSPKVFQLHPHSEVSVAWFACACQPACWRCFQQRTDEPVMLWHDVCKKTLLHLLCTFTVWSTKHTKAITILVCGAHNWRRQVANLICNRIHFCRFERISRIETALRPGEFANVPHDRVRLDECFRLSALCHDQCRYLSETQLAAGLHLHECFATKPAILKIEPGICQCQSNWLALATYVKVEKLQCSCHILDVVARSKISISTRMTLLALASRAERHCPLEM
mmetsp:Transcript_7261/g.15707  ORF Transcript_7261/g.15707 Transcript_7261/m.15707 type:complete len:258 (+) Transcript_7261:80-853(+)